MLFHFACVAGLLCPFLEGLIIYAGRQLHWNFSVKRKLTRKPVWKLLVWQTVTQIYVQSVSRFFLRNIWKQEILSRFVSWVDFFYFYFFLPRSDFIPFKQHQVTSLIFACKWDISGCVISALKCKIFTSLWHEQHRVRYEMKHRGDL